MWGTEPGTYFAYANLNFGLLATFMEAVTQTRFDVWMRNEVFSPLDMNASSPSKTWRPSRTWLSCTAMLAIGFHK